MNLRGLPHEISSLNNLSKDEDFEKLEKYLKLDNSKQNRLSNLILYAIISASKFPIATFGGELFGGEKDFFKEKTKKKKKKSSKKSLKNNEEEKSDLYT